MMSIENYKEILEFVGTKNDTIKNRMKNINLKVSNTFSYQNGFFKYNIEVMKECSKDNSSKMLYSFMNDNLSGAWYVMADNLFETFCFLHELGHLIDDSANNGISEDGYNEFKNRKFYTEREAFDAYRKIHAEQVADKFAIDFINENIIELWKIIDKKATAEEIDFFVNA